MLQHAVFETGHPWITFKGTPAIYAGLASSTSAWYTASNLCNRKSPETPRPMKSRVSNLGSVKPAEPYRGRASDTAKLRGHHQDRVRMLSINVIDTSTITACPQAKNSNLKAPPGVLGIMGFSGLGLLASTFVLTAPMAAVNFCRPVEWKRVS